MRIGPRLNLRKSDSIKGVSVEGAPHFPNIPGPILHRANISQQPQAALLQVGRQFSRIEPKVQDSPTCRSVCIKRRVPANVAGCVRTSRWTYVKRIRLPGAASRTTRKVASTASALK